jgi:tetratricopeptide (TPR) repeat protein
MRKYVVWPAAVLLLGGAATSASAQDKGAPQQPAPECDLKTSHFAVSRAVLYIQSALNNQDTTKKEQSLDGAHRSLLEALDQGQAQNPAVWHYLGIYYALRLDKDIAAVSEADSVADSSKADSLRSVLMGDVDAADSSFDKVETMMPGCQKEDDQFRYMAWAKVANQGIAAMRKNNYDQAKKYFATANQVYAKDPTTYFYTATLFASDNNADSAVAYFKQAAAIADGDTSYAEIHEKSVENVARIYQVLEQWDSAATWFRTYRTVKPEDHGVLVDLEAVYLSAAQAARDGGDSAKAKGYAAHAIPLHDSIMSGADSMVASDLFRMGVNEFHGDLPAQAADAFQAGLKQDPYYRNGLFNLTNAYFQQAQEKPDSAKYYAAKMLPAAQKLRSVDPMNRQVLQYVAAAYQVLGQNDSTDAVLKQVSNMSYEVNVQSGRVSSGGYEVQGALMALQPPAARAIQDTIRNDSTQIETLKQTRVPAAQRAQLARKQRLLEASLARLQAKLQKANGPVNVPTITFEFLNRAGNVVTTQNIAAQTINPGSASQFDLTATGDGIVAWRYKAGS